MAKNQHSFAKRQRELTKKEKQEDKRQRKLEKKAEVPVGAEADSTTVHKQAGDAED